MLCFKHRERQAVGLCKSCLRGICPDCATDLGHGLACRGVHETEVGYLKSLLDRNEAVMRRTERYFSAMPVGRFIVPGLFAVLGAGFFYFGWRDEAPLILTYGGICLVGSVVMLIYNLFAYGRPRSDAAK